MESYIPISFLNDFIFCPRSIYFHQLYNNFNTSVCRKKPQVAGIGTHKSIDKKTYSNKQSVLQSMEIYSERYNICGNIDLFYIETGKLVERKRNIKTIYDGYIFQLYAQYYALTEMRYTVNSIELYDYEHNKSYNVLIPGEDIKMKQKFDNLINKINNFDMSDNFIPVRAKCNSCIYSNLCDYSLC